MSEAKCIGACCKCGGPVVVEDRKWKCLECGCCPKKIFTVADKKKPKKTAKAKDGAK